MKMSRMFHRTFRDIPAEAQLISHKLLLQAGLINQVAAGIYSYMPLAWRSLKKIEAIVREEMDKAGAQEIKLGILQPKDLWEKSGRDSTYGPDMMRLTDRRNRDLVLPPTNEELITHTIKSTTQSYRDLPVTLYQIQTKFRDEPRPRGGLIRVREFDMMDAYSFDRDESGLEESYTAMVSAYQNAFSRCGIETVIAEADSGAIGGKDSKEFVLITNAGEDTVVMCESCNYVANDEKAEFKVPGRSEDLLKMEEVHTPGQKSIKAVSDYLNIETARTIKTLFYISDGEIICVGIRGDLDINETKLKNKLGAQEMRLASPEEVTQSKNIMGFASPVGTTGMKIIVDNSLIEGNNFVAGANKNDYHLTNVNYSRDYKADIVGDIGLAKSGYACKECDGNLITKRGIEIGHVFKLGTSYSKPLEATYRDENGTSKDIVMGCYGIGIGRILAGAIEQKADDQGIIFPKNIAPYELLITVLNGSDENIVNIAFELYEDMKSHGIDVLIDDRDESPGVKFNDADLLGIPIRLVVSARNLAKKELEVKVRSQPESVMIKLETAQVDIANLLQSLD